ncbi:unnamed protein product [Chrysoparadoxa australica]
MRRRKRRRQPLLASSRPGVSSGTGTGTGLPGLSATATNGATTTSRPGSPTTPVTSGANTRTPTSPTAAVVVLPSALPCTRGLTGRAREFGLQIRGMRSGFE